MDWKNRHYCKEKIRGENVGEEKEKKKVCLLYTSDAADEQYIV